MKSFITTAAVLAITIALVGCQDMMFDPDLSGDSQEATIERNSMEGTATISYELTGPNTINLDRRSLMDEADVAIRLLHAGPVVHLFFPDFGGASIRVNTNHGTLRGSGIIGAGRASFDLDQIDADGIYEMPREFALTGVQGVRSTAAGKLVWNFD